MPVRGAKTLFYTGSGVDYPSSTTWTKLATVTDIKPPKFEKGEIETTDIESDWKEFVSGSFPDGGEVEITLQYDKAQQATLFTLFTSEVNSGFKLVFSDGSIWGLGGFVKTFSDAVQKDKLVETTISVKVSGAPVFVPATGS